MNVKEKIGLKLVKKIYSSLNYSANNIRVINSLNDINLYTNDSNNYICINSNIILNNLFIYDVSSDTVIEVKINNNDLSLRSLLNNSIQLIMYTDILYKSENKIKFINELKESINDLYNNSFDKNKLSLISQSFIILTLELSII